MKMNLEKLFKSYQEKMSVYDNAVEFDHAGNIVNAREVSGRNGAVKKAHKKFLKAFEAIYGDDINKVLDWQNARI